MSHARLAPSSAHQWMVCPGSLLAQEEYPDDSNAYSAEGSAAHTLASRSFAANKAPHEFIGDEIEEDGFTFVVDETMADHVADYMKLVRSYVTPGSTLLIEQRVDFSEDIGVEASFGTSDAVVIGDGLLTIIDLKYGMGVRVDATDNEQLMLYALGALRDYEMLDSFEEVMMVIHQPRLNHVSEYQLSVGALRAFGGRAKLAAAIALQPDAERVTGEKQCRFCRAKSSCPALAAEVTAVVGHVATPEDFADLVERTPDELSNAMSKVDLIEQWCLAIRAEVERRLFDGVEVPGYKLVEGRRGDRKWTSEAGAEALFKSFRLRVDEMYDLKLISPTKAEKLLKASPKRWAKAETLISRAAGKPSVAPVTDKRSALAVSNTAEDLRSLAAE